LTDALLRELDRALVPRGFARRNQSFRREDGRCRLSFHVAFIRHQTDVDVKFKFLWEQEWTDERLREVARWFDFKYIELLIAELPKAKLDTFEKDAVWYQSFLEKVGG